MIRRFTKLAQAARLRRFARDEAGAILVFVAMGLPVFLLLCALVFDIGLARLHQTRLQIAADAGALAASRHATDIEAARTAAQDMVDRNYPETLDVAAVTLVHWNTATRTASAPDPQQNRPANAISVTTRRDTQTNSVVPYIFGRVTASLGGDGFSLAATAIALAQAAPACTGGNGIFSDDRLDIGPATDYRSTCLYGRSSVAAGEGVSLDDRTAVIAPDRDDISDRVRESHGVEARLDLELPPRVEAIVANARTATARPDEPEDWVADGTVISRQNRSNGDRPVNNRRNLCNSGRQSDACPPDDPFTHHVWTSGSITLRNNTTYRNMIVEAPGNITLQNNVTLENVILWAGGNVTLGNTAILTDVKIYAAGDIVIGSNSPANNLSANGVWMVAGDDIDIAAQSSSFSDITLHAQDALTFGGRASGSGNTTETLNARFFAGGEMRLRNNVVLRDTRLFGNAAVIIEDSNNDNLNVVLGTAPSTCPASPTGFDSYVMAVGAVSIGAHAAILGTQIGSAATLALGEDVTFNSSAAEIEGRADVGRGTSVRGCEKTSVYGSVDVSEVPGAGGSARSVLVQ